MWGEQWRHLSVMWGEQGLTRTVASSVMSIHTTIHNPLKKKYFPVDGYVGVKKKYVETLQWMDTSGTNGRIIRKKIVFVRICNRLSCRMDVLHVNLSQSEWRPIPVRTSYRNPPPHGRLIGNGTTFFISEASCCNSSSVLTDTSTQRNSPSAANHHVHVSDTGGWHRASVNVIFRLI